MPRTEIPATALRANAATVATPTTLSATNDHVITRADPERTILVVTNTDSGGAHTVTVKAGTNPPAMAAGQGDVTFSVAASSSAYFGPFESGRHLNGDGTVLIDIESGHTGTITALHVPRSAA